MQIESKIKSSLPNRYLITGAYSSVTMLLATLKMRLDDGYQLIQLRAKELSNAQYADVAAAALELVTAYPATLLLNCELSLAVQLQAPAISLTSNRLMALTQKPQQMLVAASCHNMIQLNHAQQLGIDFVTLSPVLHTKTHPAAKILGWRQFATLCQATHLPVYALGGMQRCDLTTAKQHGAIGIAAINAMWTDHTNVYV